MIVILGPGHWSKSGLSEEKIDNRTNWKGALLHLSDKCREKSSSVVVECAEAKRNQWDQRNCAPWPAAL